MAIGGGGLVWTRGQIEIKAAAVPGKQLWSV